MSAVYDKLMQCYTSVKQKVDFQPLIGLILGSGLGDYVDTMDIKAIVNYSDIEGFPVSTAPGHKNRYVFGYVKDIPVVVMQGRIHYYDGYDMTDVVLSTRLMGLLGVKAVFLTNAAGGTQDGMQAGDFMMITDHILKAPSPLLGPNLDELGPRFPDMSEIYKKKLQDAIQAAADANGITLKKGVYIQLTGPNFETPAEVRMCKILGADAVGMSTACEAVAANHMGLDVCGISCISNLAAGLSDQPLTHQEVMDVAAQRAPEFKKLITASLMNIAKLYE